MATYKQIQDYVKKTHGYSVKSCWIANMKEIYGLAPRKAVNRKNENIRICPCPVEKQQFIKEAFKYFEMID